VISVVVAFTAGDVYGNPVSAINGAGAGSGLLDDLQTVKTFATWLQSVAFVGLALVLDRTGAAVPARAHRSAGGGR